MNTKKRLEKLARKKAGLIDIQSHNNELFEARKRGNYKDAWIYLTQSVRGTGSHGLGMYNEDAVVGIFERPVDKRLHFHVVPLGEANVKGIDTLCHQLYGIAKTPVIVKKLTDRELVGLQIKGTYLRGVEYPWSSVPVSATEVDHSEDDNIAERVVNIQALVRDKEKGKLRHRLGHRLKQFQESDLCQKLEFRDYVPETDIEFAKKVVDQFFVDPDKLLLSDPKDYSNMYTHMPFGQNGVNYFGKIAFLNGTPVGFFMGEKVDDKTVALNAHLIIDGKDGLSEQLHMQYFEELARKGIKYVNLGGSEKESLDSYKAKFEPSSRREQLYWGIYAPTSLGEMIVKKVTSTVKNHSRLSVTVAALIGWGALTTGLNYRDNVEKFMEYISITSNTVACDAEVLYNNLEDLKTEKIRLTSNDYLVLFDDEGHLNIIPQESKFHYLTFSFETERSFNAEEQKKLYGSIGKNRQDQKPMELIGQFRRFVYGGMGRSPSNLDLYTIILFENGKPKEIIDTR